MADKKKRLCPNVVKVDGKPRCGKEFEYDPDDWNGRCPHCGCNVARYDDERTLREIQKAEEEAAAPPPEKKKKSILGNL